MSQKEDIWIYKAGYTESVVRGLRSCPLKKRSQTDGRTFEHSLLDICMDYCKTYCLDFNVKKSKVMVVGKRADTPYFPLLLNNQQMEFVDLEER